MRLPSPTQRLPNVTNRERDLVFSIVDGRQDLLTVLFYMRSICELSMNTDFIQTLEWLKKNRLCGQGLLDWIKDRHENSVMFALAHIRKDLLKDREVRPFFAVRGPNAGNV